IESRRANDNIFSPYKLWTGQWRLSRWPSICCSSSTLFDCSQSQELPPQQHQPPQSPSDPNCSTSCNCACGRTSRVGSRYQRTASAGSNSQDFGGEFCEFQTGLFGRHSILYGGSTNRLV